MWACSTWFYCIYHKLFSNLGKILFFGEQSYEKINKHKFLFISHGLHDPSAESLEKYQHILNAPWPYKKYGFTSHLSQCWMFNKLFGKSCLQTLPNTPLSSKSWFFPLLLKAGRTSPAWNLLQSLDITHKLCIKNVLIHNNICFNNMCRSLPHTFNINDIMIPINRSSYQRSKSKMITVIIIINNNLCFEPL